MGPRGASQSQSVFPGELSVWLSRLGLWKARHTVCSMLELFNFIINVK